MNGFTVSPSVRHMIDACRNVVRPDERVDAIKNISIPTAGRVTSLVRCVESYLSNARSVGRTPDFVVADGSEDPAVRARYKHELSLLASRRGVNVFYGGKEEKIVYFKHLVREVPQYQSLIEFALFDPLEIGYNVGANRNALFLHNAGTPFLSVDDDTLCQPSNFGDGHKDIVLTDVFDPTAIWPYESFERMYDKLKFTGLDFVGEHEKVLGSDIGRMLTCDSVVVSATTPAFVRSVYQNESNVAVTWSGIAGDCGFTTPKYLYTLKGTAMTHFTRNEHSYNTILKSRQITRSCKRLTLTPGGFCQSTALAFDNRAALPPFMPVLRGQDLVFGSVLKILFPRSLIAYLPVSILHCPLESRTASCEDLTHHSHVGLLQGLLKLASGTATSRGSALPMEIINEAIGIAESDLFDVFCLNHQRLELESWGRLLVEQFYTFRENPGYWKRDLVAHIRSVGVTHSTPLSLRFPRELSPGLPADSKLLALKRIISSYLKLIQAWPTIVAAASRLKKRGVVLAQPIL